VIEFHRITLHRGTALFSLFLFKPNVDYLGRHVDKHTLTLLDCERDSDKEHTQKNIDYKYAQQQKTVKRTQKCKAHVVRMVKTALVHDVLSYYIVRSYVRP